MVEADLLQKTCERSETICTRINVRYHSGNEDGSRWNLKASVEISIKARSHFQTNFKNESTIKLKIKVKWLA